MDLNSRLDWVSSYPKSGNTWMRLLLASYRQSQMLHYNDVSVYMFQCVSPHPLHELNLVQQVQLRSAAILHIACACPADVPAIVKTHHANVDIVGMPLFAEAFCRKVVYLVRDPRDLVMSMAHHFEMTPEDCVKLLNDPVGMIRPKRNMAYILGTWSEHVTSWALRKHSVPTLVVQYEQMHMDCEKQLRKTLEFLEWPINQTLLRRAVEENEFSRLQAEEAQQGFSEQADHGAPFFRRGEVGSWREELDPKLARQVERDHRKVMEAMGYKVSKRLKLA